MPAGGGFFVSKREREAAKTVRRWNVAPATRALRYRVTSTALSSVVAQPELQGKLECELQGTSTWWKPQEIRWGSGHLGIADMNFVTAIDCCFGFLVLHWPDLHMC